MIRNHNLGKIAQPCNLATKSSIMCDATVFLLKAVECAILENESIITMIELYSLLVLGRSNTKSMLIYYQRACGTGKCIYNLVVCILHFPIWHTRHCVIIRAVPDEDRPKVLNFDHGNGLKPSQNYLHCVNLTRQTP